YILLLLIQRPTCYILFPYTTLFRSREISVFDRETDGRQLHVCHVGLGPELPSLPLHVHAARYGASERASKEIRNLETSVIHTIGDRKSTRLNSSHVSISYAVFCLKK